ncbi:transglycosylase SLT domain-containing protein [Vibrio agarivorans]|uniref:transglycosylase SLT domain-containing protein n=1 Tax=Vibrio agarivorans TaxID=153622 RepID=UPI0025B56C1F|nr:transglycosylase SLT domain-containing protein [Vibrio agarivorans]MDN3660394.1 transglycosylase SLT domain-containing protein [Vibrio agarivorans]
MKTISMTVLSVTLPLLISTAVIANDPFAELDNEVEQLYVDDTAEFEQWYAEHLSEFNKWQMAYLEQWDKQQVSSIEKWGDAKTPSQDTLVVYNEETESRTVVDLEKGEITINYPAPSNSTSESADADLLVVNKVITDNKELWQQVGFRIPEPATSQVVYVEPVKVQEQTFEEVRQEIIAQTERQMSQLDIYAEQNMVMVSPPQKERIVEQQKQVLEANKQKRIITAQANIQKQKTVHQQQPTKMVEYKVKIPSSALSERAGSYLPQIKIESAKRGLSPALVLAIMHEESHFNPQARSHVPAYGLMQIVPTTAGHDVNKLYRGNDAPMRATDLYNPEINIETGTEYLNILHNRYLKGIKDPKSAKYSVIAAYNTGSGNVAKAFGERRVSAAIKKINSMTSDQVYQQLITNLPYDETRNYLKKVNNRMQSYQAHNNSTI